MVDLLGSLGDTESPGVKEVDILPYYYLGIILPTLISDSE